MSHKKEILTAVGTLSIAVAVGFAMQSGETAEERYGAGNPQSPTTGDAVLQNKTQELMNDVDTKSDDVSSAAVALKFEEIKLTSATEVTQVPMMDGLVQRVSFPMPEDLPAVQNDPAPQIAECDISATASAVPGGLVNLDFDAPCAKNERLAVHHNGMMFTVVTDENGQLSLVVPALAEDAVFIMALANGDGAVAQATVPDLAQFDRIVLQWHGNAGFELHAREFGADYGQDGHVWSGASADISSADAGNGGFVLRLGDASVAESLMTEIYTFPSRKSAKSGIVDMSVEAEVTLDNCGRDIQAHTIELSNGTELTTRDLTLAVPDCGALGSFMVLNNLVSDLKVASN